METKGPRTPQGVAQVVPHLCFSSNQIQMILHKVVWDLLIEPLVCKAGVTQLSISYCCSLAWRRAGGLLLREQEVGIKRHSL